jgi:RHS repeat-associated protein
VPLAFTDYPNRAAAPASGRTYHVFTNPVGVALCIEDADGKVVWWADRVDPYGLVELTTEPRIEYNLRWPGHYFDPETGLHYNRHRYYDPNLGRYLQSDPIGHEGSPVNLYAYCPNPLVQVDVLGLAHPNKTSGDDSEAGPHSNKGKEGTDSDGAQKRSIEDIAAADGDTPAHREAREKVAKDFFDRSGMAADYDFSRRGINMAKPVQIVKYPPPGHVHQYVRNPSAEYPKPGLGNWVDAKGGQTGNQLGLNDDPAYRTPATLRVPPAADGSQREALQSTAAPIVDDWTHKPTPVKTDGGGTQWTITPNDRNEIAAANPGYR